MFTVEGIHPDAVAKTLAEREIAVWNGNYYAWELEQVLGLAPHGGIRPFLHYNDASTPSGCSPRSQSSSARARKSARRPDPTRDRATRGAGPS